MATTGTVTATQLNFRSAAISAPTNVIRQLPRGTRVEILDEQGEWLRVRVDGIAGFVSANFIHREPETPPAHDQDDSANATPQPGPTPVSGKFRFDGKDAVAPDGTRFARAYKRGVFNYGTTSIGAFVKNHSARFQGISPSRLRVMQAVSENEGKLEAINTWDNAFLTFGIFQWTIGAGNGPGELPSMIARLKQRSPDVFNRYYGAFGLDVADVTTQPGVTPLGFFTLKGVKLDTAAKKEKLRTSEWAYRFWLSGHDETVCQVQIEHAMDRVDLFYRSDRARVGDGFVADYVTSEYGVALLLDQHVNRPGHVPGTLVRAVEKLRSQPGFASPAAWGDAEEKRLLEKYIELRGQTNMTDSLKRAQVIRNGVTAGLASDKRGSYLV